jgi:hypothetical protein
LASRIGRLEIMVDLKSRSEDVVDKFETVFGWLRQHYRQTGSTGPSDPLVVELQRRLEESVADAAAGPTQKNGHVPLLEPISEQQKLIDLSG